MRRRNILAAALIAIAQPLRPSPLRAPRASARHAVNGAAAPQHDDDVYDVAICGAGPAGLATAAECASRGLKVCVADPALGRDWPNNYGVWIDEVEPLGFDDCVDVVWTESSVVFEDAAPGALENVTLQRPYGRVDRKRLKRRLVDTCIKGDATLLTKRAVDVEGTAVEFDDGSSVRACVVVDATGFRRKFVRHDVAFDPGFQVTYGALLRVEKHPFPLDKLVLMDYRDEYIGDDAAMRSRNERFPTFMYVMPISDTEIFFEETVLVSRPGADSADLEARLRKRLSVSYGIEHFEVLESERAAIPMGGMDPVVPQRVVGCGATASCVHPASGYMVARALEVAPRVGAALAAHPRLAEARRAAARGDTDGDAFDALSEAAWAATWPADDRRQRDFMHFGFELLCVLNPRELRDFFTGFFRLPDALWEHFLSWRLSGAGHVWMGGLVWWACIPKRFMAPMLLNSLPHLLDKLVGPFLSRGGDLIGPHTPYTEARWRPDAYYAYLADLRAGLAAARKGSVAEPAAEPVAEPVSR